MASAELKAVITAEDRASSTFQSFASKTTSQLSALGSKLAAYGAAATAAMGAGLVGAVKSAADMQMLRSSLDTLTGSAEKGAEVFKDLNKFAASTPFETKDLAAATQTMLSFGITADKSKEYLKMLGDVSMGNAQKLSGLTLAFSQVQSTGRLMGQDLLQMINQGFNPLTVISKKTGKSMSDLKKDMEKGAISADMVAEAFKTATDEGGLFYNGMEKGSKTLSGTMSTLRDNIGMAARSMVGLSDTGEVVKGGLFDKVSNAVNNLIKWLDQNKEAINRVATAFMTTLLTAIQSAINIIISIVKYLNEHRDVAMVLASIVGGILVSAFTAWAISVIAATWPILAIGVAVGAVILWLHELIANWGNVKNFFANIGNAAVNAANSVKNAFVGIWDSIKNAFKAGLNAIIGTLNRGIRAFNKIPGPDIGEIPMLAKGGNLGAGQAAIVGEQGPELFVPNSSGRVIPNNRLSGMGNIEFNFNGPVYMSSDQEIEETSRRLARQLQLALGGAS